MSTKTDSFSAQNPTHLRTLHKPGRIRVKVLRRPRSKSDAHRPDRFRAAIRAGGGWLRVVMESGDCTVIMTLPGPARVWSMTLGVG